MTLAPYTAGTAFNLSSLVPAGGTTAITANTLQVGNAGAGPVTVNGAFNLGGVGALQLTSGGAITETAGGEPDRRLARGDREQPGADGRQPDRGFGGDHDDGRARRSRMRRG